MPHTQIGAIRCPTSLAEAVEILSDQNNDLVPMAGATWLMRAGRRKHPMPTGFLSLSRIAELREIRQTPDQVTIGALVTHQGLADALAPDPRFQGLAHAGGGSANPGVRQLATLGGNLCTRDFAAGDIVPALLAADATLELSGQAVPVPLAEYLATRDVRPKGELVLRAILPGAAGLSAHARLTLRAAGDYPVAIVSVAAKLDGDNRLTSLRIAVGAVETVARHWTGLEQALLGQMLDPDQFAQCAALHLAEFTGRDAVDATGAYRLRVLPTLLRRAFADLANQQERTAA